MNFTIRVPKQAIDEKQRNTTSYDGSDNIGVGEGIQSDVDRVELNKVKIDNSNNNDKFLGDSKQFFNTSNLITGITLSANVLIDNFQSDTVTRDLDRLETLTNIGVSAVVGTAGKLAFKTTLGKAISAAIPGNIDDVIIGLALIGSDLGIAEIFGSEKRKLESTYEIRNERFSRRLNGVRISATY